MASVVALRAIVSVTVGLGSLDLALVNLVLGPRVVDEGRPALQSIALTAVPPPRPRPIVEPIPES